MSKLALFMNYSDKNKLNKKLDYVCVGYPGYNQNELPCEIVYPCTVENPRFRLGYSKFDFNKTNYVYCDILARYYFVDDVTLLNNGIVELSCSVDVLNTFGNQVKNNTICIVERQENDYNGKIPDSLAVGRVDRTVNKRQIGQVGGNATGTHIALTVTGGVSNA